MKKVKVKPGQTIYDVALQEYGNITGVFDIKERNPGVDETTDLEGMEIEVSGERMQRRMIKKDGTKVDRK